MDSIDGGLAAASHAPADTQWSDVLTRVVTADSAILLEEVNDVCHLLAIAERVFISEIGWECSAARWLGSVLQDLGIPVDLLDQPATEGVQPTDTLLVISHPGHSRSHQRLLKPLLSKSPILIVIAGHSNKSLLRLADATISIPLAPLIDVVPAALGTSRAWFELMSVICVDAIARNLLARRDRPSRLSSSAPEQY